MLVPSDRSMPLLNEIKSCLSSNGSSEVSLEMILTLVLDSLQCSVGTVHFLMSCQERSARAAKGVPDIVLDRVRLVPVGKGIPDWRPNAASPFRCATFRAISLALPNPSPEKRKWRVPLQSPCWLAIVRGVLGVAKP